MNAVRKLHNQAMYFVDQANAANRRNAPVEEVAELANKALHFEMKAAAKVLGNLEAEPTRSILFRSSASLALQCHRYGEAIRLAAIGLSGYVHPEFRDELIDVINEARAKEKANEKAGQVEVDEL